MATSYNINVFPNRCCGQQRISITECDGWLTTSTNITAAPTSSECWRYAGPDFITTIINVCVLSSTQPSHVLSANGTCLQQTSREPTTKALATPSPHASPT